MEREPTSPWTLRVEHLRHFYGAQRETPSVVFEAEQAFCPL
jgi:hypothetical protein